MKRVLVMLAVFAIAALVAAYVAMAPFAPQGGAGPAAEVLVVLDTAADRLAAIRGRSDAVLCVLGLGVLLSLLVATAMGASKPPPKRKRKSGAIPVSRRQIEQTDEDRAPSESVSSEQRIAALRRRAHAPLDCQPQGQEPPRDESSREEAANEPAPVSPPPRPVVLVRKPRDRDRDWTSDASWLGGLPRLGEIEWPRDPTGVPLPFAAQIDLADLAATCPESPLPDSGSLAFFLGTGAVVHVPEGQHDFTPPPADLPPAFEEDGLPFPARRTSRGRALFPFWPVEAILLDLPEDLRDDMDDETRHAEIEAAMQAMLKERLGHGGPASDQGGAYRGGASLWWHGALHFAGRLHEALENAGRLAAVKADLLAQADLRLRKIERDPLSGDAELAAARSGRDDARDRLDRIEQQRAALPEMIAAMDAFVADRDPWQRLDDEEAALMEEILRETHDRYPDLARQDVPASLRHLEALCLRTMITGPAAALAAMPDADLARLNGEHALPDVFQHQIFGPAGFLRSTGGDHLGDRLLLQLAYDDMMEWRWGEKGLFQFWISPQAIASRDWEAAELAFACD